MAFRPSRVRKPIGEEYKMIVYRQIDVCRRDLLDNAEAAYRSVKILKYLLDSALERNKEMRLEYNELNKQFTDAMKGLNPGQVLKNQDKLQLEYTELKFSFLCRLAEATYGKMEYEEYTL